MKYSKKLYRNYDGISSMCFAGIVLLLFRPFYIVNIGFNLSFLAVLGILLWNKKLKRFFYKLPGKLNESLSLSISSQIFSMPIASMLFNKFGFGFLIGNLILLPVFSMIIILGNFALVFYKVDFLFKIVCYILMSILTISEGAAFLLSKVVPPTLKFSYVFIISYLCIAFSIIMIKKGNKKFKFFPLCLLIIIIIDNYKIYPEISYINLGNKDVILFRYRNESILLSNNKIDYSKIKFPVEFEQIIINSPKKSIKLNKKRIIEVNSKRKEGKLDLLISYGYEKKILTTAKNQSIKCVNNLNSYDIIEVPNEKTYDNFGKIMVKYILIRGKIFKFVY